MSNAPFLLLVNPWITDFAAFDLWAKPLGLLTLASLLREGGCGVAMIDCLDRHDALTNQHPQIIPGVDRRYGTGKYPKMVIRKPDVYGEIPRYYYRHGIHPESFHRQLSSIPRPDLIWVTSIMTYWYPGIQQTVAMLRDVFPEVPIWLGGIYASLCSRHARERSGADRVVTLSQADLAAEIETVTGFRLNNKSDWALFDRLPAPALDLVPHLTYAPVITSKGCPFDCPYCASGLLQPKWEQRGADAILGEIAKWSLEYGILDFAFYDDALLLQAETSLKPVLERLIRQGPRVRFHTPNALHIRALTAEWCQLLHESGFTTVRLGLETTRVSRQREWGGKVEMEMFFSSVNHLLAAGFSGTQIGVYLLCGLPNQSPDEVSEAIRVVQEAGVQPYLAEYSPLPGTSMWLAAADSSCYDLENEPLYHNNTFFACRRPDFTYQDLLHLKEKALIAREANLKSFQRKCPPGSF